MRAGSVVLALGTIAHQAVLRALGLKAAALRFAHGPLLAQLFVCGIVYGISYLAILRAMGQLPPLRAWLPRRQPLPVPVPAR